MRLRHAVEDDWVLHVVRAGRHGVAETDVDLHRAARAIEQADHRHTDARVVGLLADFGGLHAVGLKHDAVIAGDLTDSAEQVFQMWDLGGAEAQQVGIVRRAMRYVEPDVEQQRTFEQELTLLLRNAQAVKDALQRVAGQQQVEVESFGAGLVEQPGANRRGNSAPALVRFVHARLSR